MKTRSTKKALMMSVLSLFLCFAMLAGTTYAWFTDSVTSSANKIVAGTLKIDLELLETDGTWTSIKNNPKPIFDYDKWEPGYTSVKILKIENEGSLALKWKALFVSSQPLSALADVIDVYVLPTVPGEAAPTYPTADQRDLAALGYTKVGTVAEFVNTIEQTTNGVLLENEVAYLAIALVMQTSAGNEYQGIGLEAFDIQIVATQMTAEDDSFDDQYDKDALFPGTSDAEDLGVEAITLTTEGDNAATVTLSQDLVAAFGTNADKAALKTSIPEVKADADGNPTVTFSTFEVVDENGEAFDLSDNTTPIPVKLCVGKEYAGKYATIKHDGVLVATELVDADGYVAYSTLHFCEVGITITEEAPKAAIEDVKDEAADPTKLVTILYGSHYYTVSQGMVNSWTTLTNSEQIVADIYAPEDLIAYAMMANNGDLQMMNANGNHSDLTLKADLDYTDYNWISIGRFFTNIHGEGHTISNLNDSFLGCVYDCQVYNLTLENVNAAGSAAGVVGKELAGDIYLENLVIAGTNTVTYVDDNAVNWPEEGTGVGAICGISALCGGKVDVTVTGTIAVNYNGVEFGNNTNLENLGVSTEFGLNVWKHNANATVTVANGGAITGNGSAYFEGKEIYYTAEMLQAAINNAKDGDTVYLAADLTSANGVIVTDKNITIDLCGNTFTVTSGANVNNRAFKVNGNSVVTIKNGTIVAAGTINDGAYGSVRTEDAANVTLEDLKLYSYRGYGLNVKVCTGTTVTINNCEIYAQYSGGVEAAGGTVVLNNTKIVQEGVYSGAAWCSVAIGVNGGGKVTVNSGSYYAAPIATDANAAQGTWVAYVMSSGGDLIINGGTFHGVVAEKAAAANACGIICADRAAVVNIYGGTFKSNGAILDMRNNVGTQPNPVATIYGGNFTADPTVSGLYSSNLIKLADGYKVFDNGDGTFTVGRDYTVVNNTEELIAAINNNAPAVYMNAGDYALRFTNNTAFNMDGMYIKGADGVTLAISSTEAWYGRIQADGVTFENIHFTSGVGATRKATYKNCTFDSWTIAAAGGNAETTYEGCTIKGILNTSVDFSSGDIYVKDCTVATAEYSGGTVIYFDNCTIGEIINWGTQTEATNCTIGKLSGDTAVNVDGVAMKGDT